jgi:hypothetical protein
MDEASFPFVFVPSSCWFCFPLDKNAPSFSYLL